MSTEPNKRYYVVWTSVDGAGQITPADEPYLHLSDASAECERLQRACEIPREVCNARGDVSVYVNPWNYHYRVVDGRYETIYHAFSTRAKQIA